MSLESPKNTEIVVIPGTITSIISSVTETKVQPITLVKSVAAAGTAEPIVGSSTIVKKVYIQADNSNTQNVYIGDSSVDNTNGQILASRDSMLIEAEMDENIDLNEIYVDADVNGESVRITYWS